MDWKPPYMVFIGRSSFSKWLTQPFYANLSRMRFDEDRWSQGQQNGLTPHRSDKHTVYQYMGVSIIMGIPQ